MKVYAPWTLLQIEALEKWQEDGTKHPYTCECGELLVPFTKGWYCDRCGMRQDWCHDFSLKPEE